MRVLVTRAEDGAERTAAALARLGHEAVLASYQALMINELNDNDVCLINCVDPRDEYSESMWLSIIILTAFGVFYCFLALAILKWKVYRRQVK